MATMDKPQSTHSHSHGHSHSPGVVVPIEGLPRASHMPPATSQDGFGNLPDSAGYTLGRGGPGGYAEGEKASDVTRWPGAQAALRLLQMALSVVAFSLMAAMQADTGNVALTIKPFAFQLGVGILSALYALGAAAFLLLMPRWRETAYPAVAKTQKILLHVDFVMAMLLFASSCSAASIFPLYCSAGMTTPRNVCYQMFGSAVVGIMGCFCYITLFWFLVTPYLWWR